MSFSSLRFADIEKTRLAAASALVHAIDAAGDQFTESKLTRIWADRLYGNPEFYDSGWYEPPPSGLMAIVAKAEDGFRKSGEPSFRAPHAWPGETSWTEDDILMAYASPVHKGSNLIGDFGLSLYKGPDQRLHRHFEHVMEVSLRVVAMARPGMAMLELYGAAMDLFGSEGFANAIASPSDSTGTNIGHTIPFSWPEDSASGKLTPGAEFAEIRESIRSGRVFINAAESFVLPENIAFTIEPRLSGADTPTVWFHLTVFLEGRQKRLCHGFGEILARFGMEGVASKLAAFESGPS